MTSQRSKKKPQPNMMRTQCNLNKVMRTFLVLSNGHHQRWCQLQVEHYSQYIFLRLEVHLPWLYGTQMMYQLNSATVELEWLGACNIPVMFVAPHIGTEEGPRWNVSYLQRYTGISATRLMRRRGVPELKDSSTGLATRTWGLQVRTH
jgi:hypothetical protein